jgi:hypothetical protein
MHARWTPKRRRNRSGGERFTAGAVKTLPNIQQIRLQPQTQLEEKKTKQKKKNLKGSDGAGFFQARDFGTPLIPQKRCRRTVINPTQ